MLNLSANELDGKPAWSLLGKIGFPPCSPPTAHYSYNVTMQNGDIKLSRGVSSVAGWEEMLSLI